MIPIASIVPSSPISGIFSGGAAAFIAESVQESRFTAASVPPSGNALSIGQDSRGSAAILLKNAKAASISLEGGGRYVPNFSVPASTSYSSSFLAQFIAQTPMQAVEEFFGAPGSYDALVQSGLVKYLPSDAAKPKFEFKQVKPLPTISEPAPIQLPEPPPAPQFTVETQPIIVQTPVVSLPEVGSEPAVLRPQPAQVASSYEESLARNTSINEAPDDSGLSLAL